MKNSIIKAAVAAAVLIIGVYLFQPFKEKLPVYNPTDINSELVDKSLQNLTENHVVSDFELINQNGEIITQTDYKDKFYVVDFFFTSCQTICPVMTNSMIKI